MDSQLKQILSEILDVDEAAIHDDFGHQDAPLWDSINNLRMVTAIEDEFNITLSMGDIEEMVDFKKIKETVARYI